MNNKILLWIVKLTVVIILVQTLFFKFTGAEESKYIFNELGVEPFGRITSGIVELIASILILIPRTTLFGALMALGTMAGAILSHIFLLGIEVQNDGGTLFFLALLVFVGSLVLIYFERNKIKDIIKFKF